MRCTYTLCSLACLRSIALVRSRGSEGCWSIIWLQTLLRCGGISEIKGVQNKLGNSCKVRITWFVAEDELHFGMFSFGVV